LDKNGNPIQQVTYQSSGVLLDVTPRVLGSGKINITLDGSVSSFSPTTTGVSGSPTRTKRQVQTTVTVDDGELLVIGGLNSNKEAANTSGLSFLPRSWRGSSSSTASSDLVLILSATVVK
jgi:type II secretory pathway component GspD/PulD (secretin)